jgi:hypothetical protein
MRGFIANTDMDSAKKGMDSANKGMDNAQADGTVYGLNARGPVGVAVSGQEIFPLYNNRATNTLQDCEVDACNEHVGGGGGQPHLHGDPFHATDGVCLYGPGNYTSDWAHPPQIGWSLDGCATESVLTVPNQVSLPLSGLSDPLSADTCAGGWSHPLGYSQYPTKSTPSRLPDPLSIR